MANSQLVEQIPAQGKMILHVNSSIAKTVFSFFDQSTVNKCMLENIELAPCTNRSLCTNEHA